jgi:3-methyladenine DNA glycosylase AlkC
MAQLKYMYNPAYFERLCPVLKTHIPGFDCKYFIIRVFNNAWPDLELKDRVKHITNVLHDFLPPKFPEASKQLVLISRTLRQQGSSQGFENIFLPEYIGMYGLDHWDESMKAIEELTKLVSAEYAIRPFIARYPRETMAQMIEWSLNANEHVRRLASEGCRPRLPWAMALRDFKEDPSPILPVLEKLKKDSSVYVRKSVANNLNDIAKDHPDVVLRLVKKWYGQHQHTDWILKHGCRTLLKKGNTEALLLHGFNPRSLAKIESLLHPPTVNIGQDLDFKFAFINKEKKPATFRLEYAIDYLTSSGKTSRKIFKISERVFDPGKTITISKKQSFKNFTTRKHFTGKHFLSILANGKKIAATEFIVR